MGRAWPRGVLPSAVIIFFDDMNCQFMTIKNVYINVDNNFGHQLLSLDKLNGIDYMFGHMLHLTRTLPSHASSTIFYRVIDYILLTLTIRYGVFRPL